MAAANLFAQSTCNARLCILGNLDAALDTDIVFLGLEAVVLTAGHAEFELMRQLSAEIVVADLFRQRRSINTSARADRTSLTGSHCADTRAAGSAFHIAFR